MLNKAYALEYKVTTPESNAVINWFMAAGVTQEFSGATSIINLPDTRIAPNGYLLPGLTGTRGLELKIAMLNFIEFGVQDKFYLKAKLLDERKNYIDFALCSRSFIYLNISDQWEIMPEYVYTIGKTFDKTSIYLGAEHFYENDNALRTFLGIKYPLSPNIDLLGEFRTSVPSNNILPKKLEYVLGNKLNIGLGLRARLDNNRSFEINYYKLSALGYEESEITFGLSCAFGDLFIWLGYAIIAGFYMAI